MSIILKSEQGKVPKTYLIKYLIQPIPNKISTP